MAEGTVNPPPQKAPPATIAEMRSGSWKWLQRMHSGASVTINAAVAAEGAPDAYTKADEAVRVLQTLADQARTIRDSLPAPNLPPHDQFGWLKNGTADLLSELRGAFASVKREQADNAKTIAIAVAEKLEATRVTDAKILTRAVMDEVKKMMSTPKVGA